MDPYSANSVPSSGARGFVLAIAGLLGAVVGGVGLVAGYMAYVAPASGPATPPPPPAPAPRAAQAPAPPPLLSAGRALPMPKPDAEPASRPRARAEAGSGNRASAMRAPDGHFYFDAFVNGTRIRTMFDTGASSVALTYEDAARIGINVSGLTYDIRTSTANGIGRAASVTLASVRIGDITKNNIRAAVLPPGSLGVTLLGQSFSSRVSSYRYERSELILTDD